MANFLMLLKRFMGVLSISVSLSGAAADPLAVALSGELGAYSEATWERDWPGCEYSDGIEEGRVVLMERDGQRWLRVRYPEGAIGSNDSGAGWRMPFPSAEKVELRYTLRFEEGFDFNKGGKLPGLCGGPKTITGGDRVNGKEGYSVRLMWRKDGRGQAYVYHMDQPDKYGDEFDFPETFRFPVDQDLRVRIEVTQNTPGRGDGSIRVWTTAANESEQLQLEKTGLRFRDTADYATDGLLFNTFHGGGDRSWAPQQDVWAQFGGFEVRR